MINVHRKLLYRFKPIRKRVLWHKYLKAVQEYEVVRDYSYSTGSMDEEMQIAWARAAEAFKEYLYG